MIDSTEVRRSEPAHRSGRILRRIAVVLVVLVGPLGACSDPVEPDPRPGWELRPGILLHHGIPAFMSVPDSVAAGDTFTIAFITFGPGCDEEGETTSNVSGSDIEVFPLDWTPIEPSAMCPDSIVNIFPRSIDVAVNVTGPARLRVRGRREPEGTNVTFAATIHVR